MTPSGNFGRSELTAALWAFRRELLLVGLFSLAANLLMLAPTLYMLQVYDRVLASRNELTLLAVSLLTLFLLVVMAVTEWSRSRLLVQAGVRFDEALSTRVFQASFEANLNKSGSGAAQAFSDLTELRQFLTGNGVFAVFDTPWSPIYMAVLFVLHPVLGAASVGFAVVQGALAWLGHRRAVGPAAELSARQTAVTAQLQGKLRNAEVIESMGMIDGLRSRWHQQHAAYMGQHARTHGQQHRLAAWSKGVRYAQQSLTLACGALLVMDGQLSPGAMIAANVLMARALAPIDHLVNHWRGFLAAKAAFERLAALLLAHPVRAQEGFAHPPAGHLVLSHVGATAPGRAVPILKDIDLCFEPGTVTVVTGPSGSGKSTLARVMLGIWPDATGQVRLDGRALERWSRDELGPHLGYLPQDVELFDGSIAENIARLSEVDSAKVIAAARSTGLHDMILRLPKGYDTPMGEAGGALSGGQRQRIALARALYGEPAIVVLDEPNANLDEAGETALIQTLRELKAKGKTVVVMTHRPGILAVADRRVVLQDGAVVEDAANPRSGSAHRQPRRRLAPAATSRPQPA